MRSPGDVFFCGGKTSDIYSIKKNAVWAIGNATMGGTLEQINELVLDGAIAPLCTILSVDEGDQQTMQLALEALQNILDVGVGAATSMLSNIYTQDIIECGGFYDIANIQSSLFKHENLTLYQQASYVDRKSLATKNLLEVTDAVALCFLLTCSSSDDVITF